MADDMLFVVFLLFISGIDCVIKFLPFFFLFSSVSWQEWYQQAFGKICGNATVIKIVRGVSSKLTDSWEPCSGETIIRDNEFMVEPYHVDSESWNSFEVVSSIL